MYAILSVVYGVAWENGQRKYEMLEDAIEDGEPGFCSDYNGGGEGWSYFGIEVEGFDECRLTYLDEWKIPPAADLEAQYQDLLDAIDPALKSAIEGMGKPRLVIVPSTS